jgi:non-specific protein-tyrosine kinase
VLRRRKRIISFCALLSVGAALGLSVLQTPVYAATSEVVLRTGDPGSRPAASPEEASRAARTEILVIESTAVRSAVESDLGFTVDISAEQAGDTDVIRIRAESSDPGRALQAADAFANTFVEIRTGQLDAELKKASEDLQVQLNDYEARLQSQSPGAEQDRLATERDRLQDRADDLQLDDALSDSYVKVLSPATSSGRPVEPRTVRNSLLGLAGGLLLGVLIAFLLQSLDDSVATSTQLEQALRNIPVVAVIPAADPKAIGRRQLVTLNDPGSPTAEGYRKLRTALQFAARERPMQSLQVTSPNSMQGKTTTVANLGIVLAQAGLRVVVVDCDLRRPRLHELFGIANATGFTSVLAGDVPLSVAVGYEEDQPGLAVLPSGPLPSNPSELLASQRTVEVLTSLQAAYDVVLLDSPPVLAAADAVVLSRRVDGTLIVTVAEVTTRRDSTRAAEALRMVDAPLVGAVLHGSTSEAAGDDPGDYIRVDEQEQEARAEVAPRRPFDT